MALTPEEVINKRFQATKFKEGYNPEEVDDFLDEIVIELRRLNAENSSLKRQLDDAESRAAQAQASVDQDFTDETIIVEEPLAPQATEAPSAAPVADTSSVNVNNNGPASAAALLAMAQKVHDDYVLEGQREKERMLSEGRDEAASLVNTAKDERSRVLNDLESTKATLEAAVVQLRQFEQQYRSSLRAYLEDQLVGLESSPLVESGLTLKKN